MLLNIADIPDEGLEQELDIPVVPGENVGSGTARVRIKVFRTGKKVLVQGSLRVSLSLRCSRCLQEFSYPVAADFSDEYSPAEEFESEGEQELTAGEMDLSYYRNEELNLSDVVREQVLLSLPMKPLCRPDCGGLCPHCGRDLNRESCQCREEDADPRLDPLRKLKKSMEDSGKT
ncbi:MAG: DUF177 domain-containing protein [Nitrospiraceae bacterium]|nr:MAG: DUF177 domain-containing protein [Nitrospiraceae bacterium]